MTTYNTGNPLGSTAPKDLYDNAENFDNAMNSESPAFFDRFGKHRETWAGMETIFETSLAEWDAEAQAALLASGLAFIGDYDLDGPLTITLPNQVFSKDGEYWRSGPGVVLPYTTVNNWVTDQPNFVSAGEAVIRSDLNSALPNLGVSLVRGAIRHVDTRDQVRALPGLVVGKVLLGGVGPYYADTADTTSPDNGGTILASTVDSVRYKLAVGVPFDSGTFGAVGDNATNDTTPLNNLATYCMQTGQNMELDKGRFVVSGGSTTVGAVAIDTSAVDGEAVSNTRRVSVIGKGQSQSLLMSSTVSAYALSVKGDTGIESHYHSQVEGIGFGASGGGGVVKNGLYAYDLAYAQFKDLSFAALNVGLRLDSVLSSDIQNVTALYCNNGLIASKATGFSGSNALRIGKYVAGFCPTWGAQFLGASSSNVTFDGGSIEACGTHGNSGTGGIAFISDGTEGNMGAHIRNMYFENNGGAADISFNNPGSRVITHIVEGCNFNRISSTNYTTNNIIATGGPMRIILIGCTFDAFNDYVESALRLYVNVGAGIQVICIGCNFGNAAAQGTLRNINSAVPFNGQVSGAGVGTYLPPGWSSAHASTGTYTITHNLGIPITQQSMTATSISGSPISVQRWVPNNTNQFTVVLATSAGVLTDCDFSFHFAIA